MTTASRTPGPGPGRPGSFVLGQHFANIRLVRPVRLVRFGSVGWFNQRYDIMRFASRYIALYICIHINSMHSSTTPLSLSLSVSLLSLCLALSICSLRNSLKKLIFAIRHIGARPSVGRLCADYGQQRMWRLIGHPNPIQPHPTPTMPATSSTSSPIVDNIYDSSRPQQALGKYALYLI